MAKTSVRVEGLRELDAALGELPKATGRNVLRRTLMKAGRPIADEAKRLVPVDEGHLRDSITVSPKIRNNVGKAEYAAAMAAGLGVEAATAALRGARRAAGGQGSFAEMYVGPTAIPYAHMVEFGSIHNTPKPYMRPAFDSKGREALAIIGKELGNEIDRAAKRLARKAARAAAKATG